MHGTLHPAVGHPQCLMRSNRPNLVGLSTQHILRLVLQVLVADTEVWDAITPLCDARKVTDLATNTRLAGNIAQGRLPEFEGFSQRI